jgi:monoamine oxidase
MREQLEAAFPAERLLFAGEACRSDGLAGTVGGAFLSGEQAATRLMQLL